jgi:uncharacterized membrane-anchored protein YitT (DUF2179 family)
MKSQPNIVRHVFDVVLLVVGSTVMALAYNLFLIPHQIVPGGVSGISMILNHFFQTPVGLVSLGLNIPLFILGVRVLGRTYGLKSLAGVVISCLMIDLFTYVLPVGKATDDIILACVFGGITLGAGLGLVFRGGGSTGGSDIVGQVLNRYTNLSIGSAILLTDTLIVSAAGAAFSSIELALYGFLNLYLATRTIDLVIPATRHRRLHRPGAGSAAGGHVQEGSPPRPGHRARHRPPRLFDHHRCLRGFRRGLQATGRTRPSIMNRS